ncbi:hypothetical protein niasHT_021150 [Heterodera trifolii]|uniref:Uncharacterized protein n=1 Tax=Heterodera trifolii TaxID=157864 RepID=A0ABD2JF31_9BILA
MIKRKGANKILIGEKTLITDSIDEKNNGEEGNANKCISEKGNADKCVCRFLWNYEVHGMTALLKGPTVYVRLFWAFVIALCVLASVITAFYTFEHYFERHTVTYNSIKRLQEIKLPVIVLCPKNPDALNFSKVLRDIDQRLPVASLDRHTLKQLIRFAVAGAGFSNVEGFVPTKKGKPKKDIDYEIQQLDSLFRRWLGNRSLKEFYKNLFEDWGYTCQQFIQRCYFGSKVIHNCCSYFEPYFVMLRGRCMRMNVTLYQKDPADFGRFDVYMNQLPSRLSNLTPKKQPQVIAYLTDTDRNVGLFPRYYINFGTAVSLRAKARNISMLADGSSQCQNYKTEEKGRNTCRLKQWLKQKVISQHNCTLFYLDFENGTICEPKQIMGNYERITDLRMNKSERCLPACKRSEHIFSEYTLRGSIWNARNYVPPFRMEVYFTDLQIEVYEEVPTLTVSRFIAQLGGQLGLYIGLSIASFVQIILPCIRKCHEWMKLRTEKRPKNKKENEIEMLRQRSEMVGKWLDEGDEANANANMTQRICQWDGLPKAF